MINRKRVAITFNDPSRAIQSQKDEANINTIVRNFGVTGRVPVAARLPEYGDFCGINDYQSALHAIKEADASFSALPAQVRKQFNHDAGAFVDFALDPNNLPQLREWGLAPTPPQAAPPVDGGS